MRLPRVLVLGGGELGSAVAHRLARSGMPVAIADLEQPTCIRTAVCFAMALREGSLTLEGVTGVRVKSQVSAKSGGGAEAAGVEEALEIVRQGSIAVTAVDVPAGWKDLAAGLAAEVVVDARMLKGSHGVTREASRLTIGLGPGFTAGQDVDVAIETNRGHNLGRLIYSGRAEPDTGVPAAVAGYAGERVIRAPSAGVFRAERRIGEIVEAGSPLGEVRAESPPQASRGAATGGRLGSAPAIVSAPIAGLLRGLILDGTAVRAGQKIGDVDPRGSRIDVHSISDKARAVAGGVLEAIMHWWVAKDV